MTYEFTEQMPHGKIEEVFPDVYFVTGTTKPVFQGQQFQFSRNMTIVREGDALTVINTVRLDDNGLAALDKLGRVRNVVRLGSFHGYDDAFYVDRYDAKLWALEGMKHDSGLPTGAVLKRGGQMPFGSCSLFRFDVEKPEGLLLIDREGGILVSCDSLQNWVEADEYFSEESKKKMGEFGFLREANIGPGWKMQSKPKPSDFERIKELKFRHLLSAHGIPLKDKAHEKLSATFKAQMDV